MHSRAEVADESAQVPFGLRKFRPWIVTQSEFLRFFGRAAVLALPQHASNTEFREHGLQFHAVVGRFVWIVVISMVDIGIEQTVRAFRENVLCSLASYLALLYL